MSAKSLNAQDTVSMLRDGWVLKRGDSTLAKCHYWLEPGLPGHNQCARPSVNPRSFRSLVKSGIIVQLKRRPDDPYWLSRWGLAEFIKKEKSENA